METALSQETARRPQALRRAAVVALGVGVLTLSAKLHVPFWPVPLTLQTFAVMALALVLGPARATVTFLAYLACGAAGLPVFSGTPERGLGLAYMVGPTGGYLLGFLLASGVTGHLARRFDSAGASARRAGAILGRFGAMLVGLVVVYACGLAWLGLFVPAGRILPLGLFPFLLSDLIDIAVLALGLGLLPAGLRARLRAGLGR
ncbi:MULTISPECIES: biotin transporter BioY [unclassified Xanthobacter]|uniref:biotin transporter BioY n=1 Tax=unclassified Xanthobacter TaxID=2623496 RepID=UPI001EDE2FA2|nr:MULTISPECIES: biotin transporter BioY [unclassified Xanthobacter]